MTEYSKEIREEAARRANAENFTSKLYDRINISTIRFGRALCQAVLDGALHLDPEELDRARLEEAKKNTPSSGYAQSKAWWEAALHEYRRRVREGWTPPEPVDPVEQVARELMWKIDEDAAVLSAALAKLGLKIVKDGQ